MPDYQYVFGTVPSRRLGLSLGISPVPAKTCNYSCIYCQLGRTRRLTNERGLFYSLTEILNEFQAYTKENTDYDVVTIVGEGEPTLYLNLGGLIRGLRQLTPKPVAVITNGALLYEKEVREQLVAADIVLPSLDACDQESFTRINRPFGKINFSDVYKGLLEFSHMFQGELWVEMMIVKGLNDTREYFFKMKELLDKLSYSRLYLNVPVRPPAEDWVEQPLPEAVNEAVKILGGIAINSLASGGFYSVTKDNFEAVLSIIRRHPMNQYEIRSFLGSRNCAETEIDNIFTRLNLHKSIEIINYKSYYTYRFK